MDKVKLWRRLQYSYENYEEQCTRNTIIHSVSLTVLCKLKMFLYDVIKLLLHPLSNLIVMRRASKCRVYLLYETVTLLICVKYYNLCLPSTVSSSFFFLYSLGLKSLLPTFILTSTFTTIQEHFINNSKINQALSIKIFTLPSPNEFPWSKEFSWSKEVTIGNNKMRM